MADINKLKELRKITGAGMLDSKKALDATDNNIEEAIEWLRKNGIAKASKKAGRIAAEGIVFVKENDTKVAMIEVNSETDFVASNENFLTTVEEIMEAAITEEIKVQDDLLKLSINGETVADKVTNLIATIGEKISIRRYVSFNKENVKVGWYKHSNNRIASIIISNNKEDSVETLKDVAMHVTALNPRFAYIEDIDEEYKAKEEAVIIEQYKEKFAGKPEHILNNIIEGALKKQFAEVTLMEQDFVKNSSKKVKDLFNKSKIRFIRYEVGEGIEKVETDFAKEVMDQINKK